MVLNLQLMHDEIQQRLSDGNETVRLDALKKVYKHDRIVVDQSEPTTPFPPFRPPSSQLHVLGLLTPQLLPAFLGCFTDDHVSIKIEAIAVS